MKRLFFCFALVMGCAALLAGCAMTDYSCTSDPSSTNGSSDGVGVGTKGTKGKAHVKESSQVATILPDGTTREPLWYVDQKTDGTQKIDNFMNTGPSSSFTFHSDLYCNPHWNGCSAVSTPPEGCNDGSAPPFDAKFNATCDGGSLTVLTSMGRTYECGNSANQLADRLDNFAGISIGDALDLVSSLSQPVEIDGQEWMMITATRDMFSNLHMAFEDGSVIREVTMPDQVSLAFQIGPNGKMRALFNANSPIWEEPMRWLDSLPKGVGFSIKGNFQGHTFDTASIGGLALRGEPNFYNNLADQYWNGGSSDRSGKEVQERTRR